MSRVSSLMIGRAFGPGIGTRTSTRSEDWLGEFGKGVDARGFDRTSLMVLGERDRGR
jgi:hypothetical protein